jgi:hypothetical protein
MSGKRQYTWYVELSKNTANGNAVMAEVLQQSTSSEDFCLGIRCLDGKRHDLWRCPYPKYDYAKVKELWDSQGTLGIKIKKVWNKEGDGGIRDATVLFTKKMRRIIQQQQQQQRAS